MCECERRTESNGDRRYTCACACTCKGEGFRSSYMYIHVYMYMYTCMPVEGFYDLLVLTFTMDTPLPHSTS